MKIVFVMARPDMTGGCKVIAIHAERLAQRGHEVVVVSSGSRPPTLRHRLRTLLRRREWIHYQQREPNHLDFTTVDHRMLDRFRPVVERDVPDADVVIAVRAPRFPCGGTVAALRELAARRPVITIDVTTGSQRSPAPTRCPSAFLLATSARLR